LVKIYGRKTSLQDNLYIPRPQKKKNKFEERISVRNPPRPERGFPFRRPQQRNLEINLKINLSEVEPLKSIGMDIETQVPNVEAEMVNYPFEPEMEKRELGQMDREKYIENSEKAVKILKRVNAGGVEKFADENNKENMTPEHHHKQQKMIPFFGENQQQVQIKKLKVFTEETPIFFDEEKLLKFSKNAAEGFFDVLMREKMTKYVYDQYQGERAKLMFGQLFDNGGIRGLKDLSLETFRST